ncbi:non-homologous end-joining DNA ligase [Sporomusa acidovorans]|uniref:DNA ligase (ATP) n=1 Tax=Sporomusa acidovorans (strain ATCC 49682 / DSM 3132 / Mol) TaxID=1123286 RepID=A0ABZ3J4E0_SPOA4|nr:non-homologous end-joining DNA ligase [Sporomusa acidovorans]OZC16411.1 hypothetical protein SPACI_43090 [Sporomusa acidovorans DSM 3132]SDE99483.1 bifunctional non-homologous end joining protein LigD [Sporomusa acidovorans]
MSNIKPMLAKTGQLPASQSEYSFEIKWDGIRALFYLQKDGYKVMSRNLKDITFQYPELASLAATAGRCQSELILDGEIVAFDSAGLPSFSLLQHRMGVKDNAVIAKLQEKVPITYIIFDILSLDNCSLLKKNYLERRFLLENLALHDIHWQTPAYKTGDGKAILTASRQLGLEGIIAKRLDSHYEAGKRSGAWLKIKNQRRQELVIGGWIPGQGSRKGKIGALLLGYYDKAIRDVKSSGNSQQLLYAGKVGTGFTQSTLSSLAKLLSPLEKTSSPFTPDPGIKGAQFVDPVLVGEFEFTEWTPNHTLRHPSFKGLRNDKDPRQVIRED